MEITESHDSTNGGASPPPTLAREAEATKFLLQFPDIIPSELADLLTVNQKSSILGIIIRKRLHVDVAAKSDKYPTIDDWMVNELKNRVDPFKQKEDKKYIEDNAHLIPVPVANLMRPNIRRKYVGLLQSRAKSGASVFNILEKDPQNDTNIDSNGRGSSPVLPEEAAQPREHDKTPEDVTQPDKNKHLDDVANKETPQPPSDLASSGDPKSPHDTQMTEDSGTAAEATDDKEGEAQKSTSKPTPPSKKAIKISLQKSSEEQTPKKMLGLKIAEWVPRCDDASFRNCENVAENEAAKAAASEAPAAEQPKYARFLVGMEVRVSDNVPDKLKAGQEGVLIQLVPDKGTVIVSLENKETISVSAGDLEPFIPDVDEPCKLLIEGETEKLARMKEYIENNEDNVLVQFADGSCREVALEQLCKVRA